MEELERISLAEEDLEEEMEFSPRKVTTVLIIFLQVVLALFIPSLMIAMTHEGKYKKLYQEAKGEYERLVTYIPTVINSDVETERKKGNVKAEEAQWLILENALNEVEAKTRNEELYLSLFLNKPKLDVLSGAKVVNRYFIDSCQGAKRKLLYTREEERDPTSLEGQWLEAVKKKIAKPKKGKKGLEIVEKKVTADDLFITPNLVTSKNKSDLNLLIKQKVNALYEDTVMLQSKILGQLQLYYEEHPKELSPECLKIAEKINRAQEVQQYRLLPGLLERFLLAMDEHILKVLEKQNVKLLPEVWQRSRRQVKR